MTDSLLKRIFSIKKLLIANIIAVSFLGASALYLHNSVSNFKREIEVIREKEEIKNKYFDAGYNCGVGRGKHLGAPLTIRKDGKGNLRIETYARDKYIADTKEGKFYSATRPATKQELNDWWGDWQRQGEQASIPAQ